jgi:hypothetical protein
MNFFIACDPCDSKCSLCTGPSNSECSKCATNNFLYVSTCDQTCPDGFWRKTLDNSCSTCDSNVKKYRIFIIY